ncbi:hypothetical protein GWI33_007426 [Rhynchophorus ferrugineus]|uniref:Uncharacterized protein n=1 Tax=Rhynchophorus ferrugineus TaxID=354439 RepID=A0A834IJW7_RHYFE|nr:hypothetical protein GWI33_007426 [Rhynchophorus ferrugineus]
MPGSPFRFCKESEANFDSCLTEAIQYAIGVLKSEFDQKGDYTINRTLMDMPIFGKGKADVKLDNLEMTHEISLEIESLQIECNKLPGDTLNKLMNEEWELLFRNQTPAMEKAYANEFKIYVQAFFDKIAANDLF